MDGTERAAHRGAAGSPGVEAVLALLLPGGTLLGASLGLGHLGLQAPQEDGPPRRQHVQQHLLQLRLERLVAAQRIRGGSAAG